MSSEFKISELPPKLKVVAVTKGRSIESIQSMLKRTGLKRIAENRIQEAAEKLPHLPKHIEKHFIGKLQSRKIPEIVKYFDVIQSLENIEQAQRISQQGKDMKVMLQVNISGQSQRSGCKPEDVNTFIRDIQALPHLELKGVMGIASHDPEKAAQEFRLLKDLQGELEECSMGMSDDYVLAIQEGSTMLRIGRLLFE